MNATDVKVMLVLDRLNYHIFHPQNPFNTKSKKISDSSYTFWMNFWNDFYKSFEINQKADENTFLKQNIIATITYENEIVGMHLYTFYNLDSKVCSENPYLKVIPCSKFAKFKENGLKTGMAMEYLSVNPKFRKSKSKHTFGDILIGLGLKIISQLDIDCVFGIARSDAKVNEMSEKFGGTTFHDGIQMYGFPCCFAVISKKDMHSHPNQFTQKTIDSLWLRKNDHLNYPTQEKEQNNRIAA